MARITYVKKAQQRYATVPVLDEDGRPKQIPVMARSGQQKVTKKGKPVFMKVTVADKSQPLPPLVCESCRKDIEIGTPYKWVKPKSGPYGGRQRSRHASCPNWKPSELTGSQHLSTLYGAQEAAEEALGLWDREDAESLRSIIEDFVSGLREAVESYTESADNMEDGFGHETYMSAELREKADGVESAADNAESIGEDIEDFDEDDARTEVELEILEEYLSEIGEDDTSMALAEAELLDDFDSTEFERRIEDAIQTKRDEWADEMLSKAEEAVSELGI